MHQEALPSPAPDLSRALSESPDGAMQQGSAHESVSSIGVSEPADSSDAAHERAIASAGLDAERHMRQRDEALRRYVESSCLTDLAEADRQLLKAREAAALQRDLILNRSPEQKARMTAAIEAAIARSPGAERSAGA